MKKDIVHQLAEVARTTPTVFEWTELPEVFTAEELFLTPFAQVIALQPGRSYTLPMPAMVAVDHRKQYKDAYNRGGMEAVKEYHQSVMSKIKK